jgi:hypothetical protein
MEIQIKPHIRNSFPLGGIAIRGVSVVAWIRYIQRLQLSLTDIQIYPIPGIVPNTLWGCLVTFHKAGLDRIPPGEHELFQMVSGNVYIPERSLIHPVLTVAEIDKLFSSGKHIIHPEFGLVELTEALNLPELIKDPVVKECKSIKPVSASIPGRIRSFQVNTVSPEEVLKNLSENIFPKQEKMKDKPLNLFEKMKLGIYRVLFTRKESNNQNTSVEKTRQATRLDVFLQRFFKTDDKWNKLQEDFEDLDKRNQKQIDKLMDLLKNNPEEALRYAIPLDEGGSARGGAASRLDFSKRWLDFSLFGNNIQSGSGTINIGDSFHQLQKQYNETAEELIKRGDYQKAAFVYMKLLKNYSKAAETLEAGKYYKEAATIHLKHTGNKLKAAQCYEKGNMTTDAITLYKELNDHEKVGDLYMLLDKKNEAFIFYEKVVTDYKLKNQYIKASLFYKDKMNDYTSGQALLLEGWKTNKDPVNCLNNYFSNIGDIDELQKEINAIYSQDLVDLNRESFLKVIQHEFKKKNKLQESLREMAYEIVATQIRINPSIVSELKAFSPNNKELMKDTLRFKLYSKKSKSA